MKKISIIAPVYNEKELIQKFVEEVEKTFDYKNYEYELILINDGSLDGTSDILIQIANQKKFVKVINFSRNFGHQAAITAGLAESNGDAIIIIDSDLQDPPSKISELINEWEKGNKIVNAKRVSRQDGFMKDLSAKVFYKFLNLIVKTKIPENVGDFRLIDRQVVNVLNTLKEKDRYLRGLTNWVGYKQSFIEYDRNRRQAGKTNYTWAKMFRLASDAIFSFSDLPVKMALFSSIMFFVIAIIVLIYTIILWINHLTIIGWPSLIFLISIFSSFQMFVLAIISEYIGRIYKQAQDRPLYIIADKINF